MQNLYKKIYKQFYKPTGIFGSLAGNIMASRRSNRLRNVWAVDLLDIQPDDIVLELGFGPGLAIESISNKLTGGKIIGIDHSELMVKQAIHRNSKMYKNGLVELHKGDIYQLTDHFNYFDKFLAVNVLHFEKDKRKILQYVKQLLKPGGTLAIVYQPRHRDATKQDSIDFSKKISNLYDKVGFSSTRTEVFELGKIPAVIILAKRE